MVEIWVNERNPNKFIEVKKYRDYHVVIKQYMFWKTERGDVKNYMGTRSKKGTYRRVSKKTLAQILEDYILVA